MGLELGYPGEAEDGDGRKDEQAHPEPGLRLAHALEGQADVAEVGRDILGARHLRGIEEVILLQQSVSQSVFQSVSG